MSENVGDVTRNVNENPTSGELLRKALAALEFLCRRCDEQGFYSPTRQSVVIEALAELRATVGVVGNGYHTNRHEPLMKDDPT